jgi:alkanesulfonate monooxygenase SsuD/methylene tetrahydromethanopterin reductase-like flavin-dependent oxidoreductase (luciferase family)
MDVTTVSDRSSWTAVCSGTGARPSPDRLGTNTIRAQASNLREAHAMRRRIRSEAASQSREADEVGVLFDLDVLIAEDVHAARRQYAALQFPAERRSLSYVGTPHGLAGLLADMRAAHVADGVVLLPLTTTTVDLVVDVTLPVLKEGGIDVEPSETDAAAH